MKLFISGSKAFTGNTKNRSELPKEVCRRLDELMEEQTEILIGDCRGVDALVQEYLHSAGYRKVTVYVSGGKGRTRHNAGSWEEKHVRTSHIKGCGFYGFYIEKDFAMAEDADQGLVVWDGESKGSFINMVNLTALGKECGLYLLPEGKWVAIRSVEDIKPFAPVPGELGDDDCESVLNGCGFSDEMREYLISNRFVSGYTLVDAIRTAPVSLDKKLDMLRSLWKKRNLKYEVYDMICKAMEHGADFRAIKREIRSLLEAPAPRSVWREIWDACREINDALEHLRSGSGFGDSDYFLYLFSEWYDTDTFTEKSYPRGAFRFPRQVFEYVRREYEDAYDPDDGYYRMELWDAYDLNREQPMYDYYIYRGEICWFEKHEPEKQENGNSFYMTVNRRCSRGDLDLNMSTPFRTGDIVSIDCRPFGPPFHAVILEARHQYDCCFPNILFQVPYTDIWNLVPLKHKFFFKDADGGLGDPMLSPLYRLRTVPRAELTESDKALLKIKEMLSGSEEKAEKLWELWCKTLPDDIPYEQVMELLGNL